MVNLCEVRVDVLEHKRDLLVDLVDLGVDWRAGVDAGNNKEGQGTGGVDGRHGGEKEDAFQWEMTAVRVDRDASNASAAAPLKEAAAPQEP